MNIVDLLNKSRGEYAYTLVGLNNHVHAETLEKIRAINGRYPQGSFKPQETRQLIAEQNNPP